MEIFLRPVLFFCVAIVLGANMRLGILGVAIKLLVEGVVVTDGRSWDLHMGVVWLSLCLGGAAVIYFNAQQFVAIVEAENPLCNLI